MPDRLTRFQIKGLFGHFNYDFSLHLSEHITILHGPNGFGKTTLLLILNELFARRFGSLQRRPFASAAFTFESRIRLDVTRGEIVDPSSGTPDRRRLTFGLFREEEQIESPYEFSRFERLESIRFPPSLIDDYVEDELERVDERRWREIRTNQVLTFEDVLIRYGERLRDALPRDYVPSAPPGWLMAQLEQLPIHFIQTQRLETEVARPKATRPSERRSTELAVVAYALQLAGSIQATLANYAATSQARDRTFPTRVLSAALPPEASPSEIRRRYGEQGQLRQRLTSAGLLDTAEELILPEREWDDTTTRVFWHYLDDVDAKLQVFSGLLDRIELFKDIINTSFQFKTLQVDKDSGFVLITDSGERLPSTALSSGEQHELIFAYQLLFAVAQGSLILIDEPEISLHVSWQHRFLDNLGRIAEITALDFLIATHSPQIIHKQWSLAVALDPSDAGRP